MFFICECVVYDVCANRIYSGPKLIFVSCRITPPQYHHAFESITNMKCLSSIFCRVCTTKDVVISLHCRFWNVWGCVMMSRDYNFPIIIWFYRVTSCQWIYALHTTQKHFLHIKIYNEQHKYAKIWAIVLLDFIWWPFGKCESIRREWYLTS